MNKDAKLINYLLLESKDSSEALANLNRVRKSLSDHWSMQAACKRIGIPSTGYFSDVLKGKRRLHPKYLAGVIKTFELNHAQAQYFKLLVEVDQTESEDVKSLTEELGKARTALEMEYIPIPQQLSESLLWYILILSTFSLFDQDPTLNDLGHYFGRSFVIPLRNSLQKLLNMGLIELKDERYALAKTRIIFNNSEDGFSHLEFLEKSILHAAGQVKSWYPKTEQSVFFSSVVTVKTEDYKTKLPEIRSRIHAILNELNTSKGDQLVGFNLQLFPFDAKSFQGP